jgi:hypothetical protein
MTELVLVCVGEKDGLPIFSPLSIEDVKAIGSQTTIACDVKSKKCLRTIQQNRSIHKYFTNLANALNSAGLDMKATLDVISNSNDIPWNAEAIKRRLWKPVQDSIINQTSTTKMERKDVSVVYDALNRVLVNRLNVSVDFPHSDRIGG